MAGVVYLVPNLLGVVPPAAVLPQGTIDITRRLRHFVVENAKPARQFLKAIGGDVPIATLDLQTIPERADDAALRALLGPARDGKDLGVISDAGCPGIADPGAALVAAAHRDGLRVVPLVGPSSLLLALMASGMNGQQFAFDGYLPVDPEERTRRLRMIDENIARTGTTHLFIETPYRNDAMLNAILACCRGSTQVCVAADLTLPTEWVRSAPAAAWKRHAAPTLQRRPAIFLLGQAAA